MPRLPLPFQGRRRHACGEHIGALRLVQTSPYGRGVDDGLSRIMLVIIFLLVALRRLTNFISVLDVVAPSAVDVVRSIAVNIMIP